MAKLLTLTLAMSAGTAVSPWVLLAAAALWLLPDWIDKWLDVRDRWDR
jgi:ABC-type nickel/cobalt efflux system permease component RcnA